MRSWPFHTGHNKHIITRSMNALQLLILSALAAASVHCATKKVKIKHKL